MKELDILNIAVVGTGGQGVFTLTNIIRNLAQDKSLRCEGTTNKGGAQRLGSVHSELRILMNENSKTIFSSQIPKGKIDVLVGMEPWEALRHARNCNKNTRLIVNSEIQRLYIERKLSTSLDNPVESLKTIFSEPTIENYTNMAIVESGKGINANVFMLRDMILYGFIPFTLNDMNKVLSLMDVKAE